MSGQSGVIADSEFTASRCNVCDRNLIGYKKKHYEPIKYKFLLRQNLKKNVILTANSFVLVFFCTFRCQI